nr:retrovirus-related Pol polyprotein from transposon TNT 1-94 [Tanacetum cinerariifolium]
LDHTKTRRPQPRSNIKNDRVLSASKSSRSMHKDLLINFVWKFLGTVRFGNDHVAAILGFGDLQWGNILIARVYFVEGLGHNLFSVGQFCDSDLEVAFRRNACFVRNLEGVDLLKGDRSTNLYTINLHEMASASPICLMARASSTKSWLWHQRLSHLNFDTINDLARYDLVAGLPKFKYHKEHLCPSCEQGKSKRASHPPKPVPNSRKGLHLLHMDLYGPMRIASINGNRYVLVIVDDYSRYTWVHFLRSKDEAPDVIIKFLKRITVLLQSPVIIIRTDNGTEFKNQVLKVYFDSVGISHQMSSVRTPQQNGVVKRRNRTLVEAARTMLIFYRVPLFLWAEAIATACFTQNRSIIHRRFNKTPYELINGRKPDISFLYVFGAYWKKLDDVMMGHARLSSDEFSEEEKMRIVEHGLPKKMCDPEAKPILEVLENYMTYRKKLDEVMMGHARLSSDEFSEEEKMRIVEHGLPKKMCDPDIPMDKELPLLLGRPFLRTCEAVIDMGCVERYEDANPKYGPVASSFLDIEDNMERALATEAYFNLFKNTTVFKKLIEVLGYKIGGSSGGVHGDEYKDDMSDQYMRLENYVVSEDDDIQD